MAGEAVGGERLRRRRVLQTCTPGSETIAVTRPFPDTQPKTGVTERVGFDSDPTWVSILIPPQLTCLGQSLNELPRL